jgi:AraC-like DNA-binding protein
LAALLGGSRELREALSAQCSGRMAVMRIGPSALALRDALRHALEAGGEAGGLSLDALCAELGTTRRTLQLAFQDHFATSVGLVTRSARLQQVRTELGSGTAPTVSEAALRSGFDHVRRFALGDAARTATAIGSRLKRKNPVHLSTHGAS